MERCGNAMRSGTVCRLMGDPSSCVPGDAVSPYRGDLTSPTGVGNHRSRLYHRRDLRTTYQRQVL
jgi:hypothetical protein